MTSPNTAQISKNLEFRKYSIYVSGRRHHWKITEDELGEFYSQFGEVIRCTINRQAEWRIWSIVVFGSKEAMNRALNSLPHHINEEKVFVKLANDLTLFVLNLSPETTDKSLQAFYSKFGNLAKPVAIGNPPMEKSQRVGFVSFSSHEDADKALENGPHMVEGVTVDVREATDSESSEGEELNKAGTGPKRIAPKRPKNAYMFWMLENRAKVAEEVGKKLALKECDKRWAGVKDKSKWEKLAADDKARWEREKANA
ncbi:RNA recognition motif domain-containing protein [Ditylenchus destructor]|nr:RNA recognition motif domain-containing protein [Ditylenchus destructor]